MQRRQLMQASACVLASGFALPSLAQAWPNRPLTLIVSSAPGAGVDLFARLLSEQLAPRLGQPVVVENRPGASGMIAARQATKAAPDGHTLFLMPNTLVISPHVMSQSAATVSVIKELAPVIMPVSTSMVLAVNGKWAAANNIKSVEDLVAYAKRQPDLPWSGSDNGSPMHVMGEQFRKESGLPLTHIPYPGVAKAVHALVAGQINMGWLPTSGNLGFYRDGSLRALATLSPTRSPQMPDVPTMAELGYKDTRASAWFGILVPPGTPQPLVARLNTEINGVLKLADVRQKLEQMGYVPEGGAPEALMAQMVEDDNRYRRIIADLRIRAN